MPGVTIRKVSEKRASCGLASLLSACQAMSIAMTTVLPVPVAILNAMRGRPGFDVSFAVAQRVLDPGVAVLPGDLGDVDGGFERFDLAEEELLLAVGIGPVVEQARGRRRDADVAALAPERDAATDVVDELVLFDAVLGPLGVEQQLLGPLLLRLGDGDEIRTGPAAVDDLVGDALVGEPEMARRLVERRVDDRVLDDDLTHTVTFLREQQALPSTIAATKVQSNVRRLCGKWSLLRREEACGLCLCHHQVTIMSDVARLGVHCGKFREKVLRAFDLKLMELAGL